MPPPPLERAGAVITERYSYLRALVDQPRSKRDLEDELDGSRSTLDRALRDLADAGLARYEDGVWRPTLLGRCSYEAREAYLTRFESLFEAAPVLNELSSGSPVDCAFVVGADVYESDPSMPDQVVQTLLDGLEQGRDVSVVTPAANTGLIQGIYRRVSRGESYSLELIVQPDVFECARTSFPTLTGEMLEDGDVSVYTASIPFNFGLCIADSSWAGAVVFTDYGVRGILVSGTKSALDWATEQYARVRQEAEPVSSNHPE